MVSPRHWARSGELELTPRRIEQLSRFLMGSLQALRVVARADPASPALADIAATGLRTLDQAATDA